MSLFHQFDVACNGESKNRGMLRVLLVIVYYAVYYGGVFTKPCIFLAHSRGITHTLIIESAHVC